MASCSNPLPEGFWMSCLLGTLDGNQTKMQTLLDQNGLNAGRTSADMTVNELEHFLMDNNPAHLLQRRNAPKALSRRGKSLSSEVPDLKRTQGTKLGKRRYKRKLQANIRKAIQMTHDPQVGDFIMGEIGDKENHIEFLKLYKIAFENAVHAFENVFNVQEMQQPASWFRGVARNSGSSWQVRYKDRYLGSFATEEEAARVERHLCQMK